IRPKHPGEDPSFHPETYYQVYDRKFGFQPNLSILDLLFNEGNEAVLFL
ncbi:MAG: WbqC family protein, partial [Prevotella sp.]|nr:WbqC family protein [Prevotella sp.]